MRDTITIKDKTINVASNALTPILYRQIFKKDFLKEIAGFMALRGKKASDYTEEDINTVNERSEAFSRLAFIMNKQAEIETAADLVKLTDVDYYTWLCGFENQSFSTPDVLTKILAVWKGNAEDSQVESKN